MDEGISPPLRGTLQLGALMHAGNHTELFCERKGQGACGEVQVPLEIFRISLRIQSRTHTGFNHVLCQSF